MSANTDADDWEALAEQLHERGDVPEKRARVVALIHTGRTHQEVADELQLSNRGEVGTHLARYRNQDLPEAKWLAEHGPEV